MRMTIKKITSTAAATTAFLNTFWCITATTIVASASSRVAFTFHQSSVLTKNYKHATAASNKIGSYFVRPFFSSQYLSQYHNLPKSSSHSMATGHHYYFPRVGSTQDEARKILNDESFSKQNNKNSKTSKQQQIFSVSSAEQTNARGTSGRSWIAPRGNTFLTVAFPCEKLHIQPTLLPLQMGCIVAKKIQSKLLIQTGEGGEAGICKQKEQQKKIKVKLKWPNDVLVQNKKIAGILIESERDVIGRYWFIVGIGVNWKIAPKVHTKGHHRGRETTCMCDYFDDSSKREILDSSSSDVSSNGDVEAYGSKQFGNDIVMDIEKWIEEHHSKGKERGLKEGEDIVKEWESLSEFGKEQIIRDAPDYDVVIPLNLEPDGRLRVKGIDGKERKLCTEYLF